MDLKLPIAPNKKGPERAISVGELIKELKKFDPKMAVSYHNGWVVGVKKTKGRSQITCSCYPNCGVGCVSLSKKICSEDQVQVELIC